MPRKAPDKVIEHRISLSNFERERINTLIRAHKVNSGVRGVTNAMGAVSLPLLAAAALIWVGIEPIEKLKSWIWGIADPISDYITKSGVFFNYTADEIGRAIVLNEERKIKLGEEYEEYISSYTGDPEGYNAYYNGAKPEYMCQRLTAYSNREKVLRQMLRDIASGKNTDMGWMSVYWSDEQQALKMQQYYEEYADEMGLKVEDLPSIDWEIDNEYEGGDIEKAMSEIDRSGLPGYFGF